MAPPFAMKAADGTWEGISIDLLAAIAAKLGVTYQLQETTLAGMIDDVADGKLDASIAAMTMTGAREQVIDFSYAFFRSSLGVVVAERRQAGLAAIWDALTSRAFLSVVGALAGVRRYWRGIGVTLFINWAVKPFSMALLGTLFIGHWFAPLLPAESMPSPSLTPRHVATGDSQSLDSDGSGDDTTGRPEARAISCTTFK